MHQALAIGTLALFFSLFIGTGLGGLCDTPDSSYFSTELSAFQPSGNSFSQSSENGGEIETDCSSESDADSSAAYAITNDLGSDVTFDFTLCHDSGSTVESYAATCDVSTCEDDNGFSGASIPTCPSVASFSVSIPNGRTFVVDTGGDDVGGYNLVLDGEAPLVAPPSAPTAPTAAPMSTGGGDPHFKGFKGQKFDFNGVAGHFYNLLSDCNLQVNTKFISIRNLTFMGEIGMMVDEHKVDLTPGENPILDGKELRESGKYQFGARNYSLRLVKDAGHVFLTVPGDYEVKVMDIPWPKYNTNFHNIKITDNGMKGEGIIGHTWQEEIEEDLEGNYCISSLFDTKFPRNRFGSCDRENEEREADVWTGFTPPPPTF